jgi:hypothetical protein
MDQEQYQRELWHQAAMWYGVSMLPALRGLSPETLDQLIAEANMVNSSEPLYLCRERQFVLPTNGKAKLSGGEVTAILIFGLWVKCGESETAYCLLEDWPEIKTACYLVDIMEAA